MSTNPTLEAILAPIYRAQKDINAIMMESPLDANQARLIVDLYYQVQKSRVGTNNRIKGVIRDAKREDKKVEPHDLLTLLLKQFETVEHNIQRSLAVYGMHHEMHWFFEQTVGVGPVIEAGLLAHIDIDRAPTVGHIWRYAGLDPTLPKAQKGEKRKYNSGLKTLCWKLGESFVKVSNNPRDYYGKLYKKRKSIEWERNLRGELADQARKKLATTNIGKSTDAYKWYSGRCDPKKARKILDKGTTPTVKQVQTKGTGVEMLPPDHIYSRAKRFTVKIFLAHLHECWRRHAFIGEEPPVPYIIAHGDHEHKLEPPQVSPDARMRTKVSN